VTSCGLCFDIVPFEAKTKSIFSVASHVGNPCGHTFCGACGWHWHVENVSWLGNVWSMTNEMAEKQRVPLLPQNTARSNAYDSQYCHGQHRRKTYKGSCSKRRSRVGARRSQVSGMGREKKVSFNDLIRNFTHFGFVSAWRSNAKERETKQIRQTTKAMSSVVTNQVFQFILEDDVEEDPTYEDSDLELIPRPIQRSRRQRRRG